MSHYHTENEGIELLAYKLIAAFTFVWLGYTNFFTVVPKFSSVEHVEVSQAPKKMFLETEPVQHTTTTAKATIVETTEEISRREARNAYVARFATVAVEEMNKYGIPASISLAQGLLESGEGRSRLAKKNKNHFGLKCFSKKCKKGHCSNFTDDTHKDFFLCFKSDWESWRYHSKFLKFGTRYQILFELDPKDYRAWAHGLKECGYATSPTYAEQLIRLIQLLNLDQYDQ